MLGNIVKHELLEAIASQVENVVAIVDEIKEEIHLIMEEH